MGSETEYGLYANGANINILSKILSSAPPEYLSFSPTALARRYQGDFQISPAIIKEIMSGNVQSGEGIDWIKQYHYCIPINQEEGESILKNEAGRFTLNGGRIYIDGYHFESCTPGCSNAYDLLVHEKALERISARLASKISNSETPAFFIKNNSDAFGHSWGYHLNILLSNELFESLISKEIENNQKANFWLLFLVSFIIVCGAGKVIAESPSLENVPYQISQRADFVGSIRDSGTMFDRPLINTRGQFRDRVYSRQFKRLHIICLDSNMSEVSTFLKAGVSNLVIKMLEHEFLPAYLKDLRIINPVKAFKLVSKDLTTKRKVIKTSNGNYSALAIQTLFLKAAMEFVNVFGVDNTTEKVISKWKYVIECFKGKPDELSVVLDWKIKEKILKERIKRWNTSWADQRLKVIDLKYHNTEKDNSLYYRLERSLGRITTDEKIEKAELEAPTDTRSYFTGFCVKHLKPWITDMFWHYIDFKDLGRLYMEPFDFTKEDIKKNGSPVLDLSKFERRFI